MSSKRHIKHRQHNNKIPYETFEDAQLKCVRLLKDKSIKLLPYICEVCGKWHIGHPTKKALYALRCRRYNENKDTLYKQFDSKFTEPDTETLGIMCFEGLVRTNTKSIEFLTLNDFI